MTDTQRLKSILESADDANPIVTLSSLRVLRGEVDRFESVAVRRARTAGCSWAGIAAALGVSKQAVHKKYGR